MNTAPLPANTGKPRHYVVVVNSDADRLSREVQAKLQEGWALYGPPFGCPEGIGQALVR